MLALNLPFLICHPEWPLVTIPFGRSLVIGSVLFVIPGLPLAHLMARADRLKSAPCLWLVFFSSLIFIAVVVVRHLLAIPVTAGGIWAWTWIATNAGVLANLLTGHPKGRMVGPERHARSVVLVFLFAYALLFYSATRVVPILSDQDDEVQGTAYGLLTHLKPSLLTGRKTEFLFAHPPLAHIYVAGSILYHGQFQEVAVYDSLSPNRLTAEEAYQHYAKHPFLLETRTPNIFLSAPTVAVLWHWASRLTGAVWFASIVTALYVTNPEVFVRSAYGGYFAIGSFCFMHMLIATNSWMQEPTRPTRQAGLLAGGLSALADHKMVLLPAAVAGWAFLRSKRLNLDAVAQAIRHPLVIGFAVGTSLFWLYGLSISPTDFWMDHVRHHVVDRVLHNNARGLDTSAYPGVAALWMEFLQHTGYLFVPLGAVALVVLCFRRSLICDASSDQPSQGWVSLAGVWGLWAVITAVAFTIIDWRQTKHLAPLTLPLTLAIAGVWTLSRARLVLIVLIGALLIWNLQILYRLSLDFNALPTVPDW